MNDSFSLTIHTCYAAHLIWIQIPSGHSRTRGLVSESREECLIKKCFCFTLTVTLQLMIDYAFKSSLSLSLSIHTRAYKKINSEFSFQFDFVYCTFFHSLSPSRSRNLAFSFYSELVCCISVMGA
jgi:hypothetical protein